MIRYIIIAIIGMSIFIYWNNHDKDNIPIVYTNFHPSLRQIQVATIYHGIKDIEININDTEFDPIVIISQPQ